MEVMEASGNMDGGFISTHPHKSSPYLRDYKITLVYEGTERGGSYLAHQEV
jgi:hypothetical protein